MSSTQDPSLHSDVAGTGGEHDALLAALVQIVNSDPRAALSATLLVGGAVVSGMIESAEAWWGAQQEAIGGVAGELSEAYAAGLGEVVAMYRTARLSAELDDADVGPTTFVHMRDVEVHGTGGGVMDAPYMRWRCRLSAVDGWMLGALGDRRP